MHDIKAMARYAKIAGAVLTIVTVGITARFGWLQGEDLITSVCYMLGLGSASFLVGYGLVFAYGSYKLGLHWTITAACIAVFIAAVGVEMMSHLGATASARNHDIANAADATDKHKDKRVALEQARADLAAMKPTRTPAAISADMASIETKPWFSETSQCASPGRYKNSCDRYRAFKGELATAQARTALDARVQKLTAEASTSTAGHSAVASQAGAIASYATFNIRPTADDQLRTNMGIQLWLALYFVVIGFVNLIAFAIEGASNSPTPAAQSAELINFPAAKPNATLDLQTSFLEAARRKAANG